MEALFKIAKFLNAESDLDRILEKIADAINEVIGFGHCAIRLVDKEKNVLLTKVVRGVGKEYLRYRKSIPIGSHSYDISGVAAKTGKPHYVKRMIELDFPEEVKENVIKKFNIKSYLCIPIKVENEILGVISIMTKTERKISEDEIKLLSTFAELAGQAILRAKLFNELKESEERYRTLARSANDAIIWINAQGKITMWNKSAEKLFGYKEKEALGKNPYMLIVPEKYRERFERGFKRFSEYGNGVAVGRPLAVTALRKDGTKIPVEISISPIKTRDGWEAIAIIRDISERRMAEKKLRESFIRLRKILEGAVQTMARIVEIRDPYTAGHQRRVAQLACAIAREMGLKRAEIEGLRITGILHDIGKIHIPAEILTKPGKLTEEEMNLVKSHPKVGYEILKNIEFGKPVALIVLQHHERINGSGYPYGLKGDKILLEARILGVADVVEAMASHRPYRPALGIDRALEEIEKNKGILYDPDVVDACIKLFRKKGFKWEEV